MKRSTAPQERTPILRAARGLAAIVALASAFAFAHTVAADNERHVTVPLVAVGGSGAGGHVKLVALPNGETEISVYGIGLKAGERYVSLYYDNHTCELEPYSEDDVIGGPYIANAGGAGSTTGRADDEIDEINSVSIRLASDFSLVACADVHPGQ